LEIDALNCITRTDVSTSAGTKAAHQLATLRSFKLPVPKAAIAPKVTQALAELGISHTRLVMPTRTNVQQLESLIEAATALVETKRLVDKVDMEIQVAKTRLGMRAASQAADGGAGDDDMELDGAADGEGETEGEDGRGQSVVSTRSGRGRKHVSFGFLMTSNLRKIGGSRPTEKLY
jgi:DNA methyltransferase 1-associated protein 1